MKRVIILALTVLALASCKPQKPWSPHDTDGGDGKIVTGDGATSAAPAAQADADIGDVEQAVFVSGEMTSDSKGENIRADVVRDRIKRVTKTDVDIDPPHPESFWVQYDVKCTRDFKGAPAVLRARILVEDKVAGSFSVVLGSSAKTNGVSVQVDLFKPFEGKVPETFLAKVVGDLYLMPAGTDENTVNSETATSDTHSQALYGTVFRVNLPASSESAASPTSAAEPGPVETEPTPSSTPADAPAQ